MIHPRWVKSPGEVEQNGVADLPETGKSLHNVAMTSERRITWAWVAVGASLALLIRAPMLGTPITSDEGGYLAIARAWAHGKVLYHDVWIDRPQGLLVLFRVWDWLSGGNTSSLRVMAMLFGVLLVVATAVIVREVAGDRAARIAAVVCGILSATPVLEAHTANGELLSGSVSAAGLAVAVVGLSKDKPLRWLFAAGVLAGLALSLKQSGFDGLLALFGWLIVVAMCDRAQRPFALRAMAATAAGVVTVIALLVVHGALTGWSRWWWAVAGYRLQTQSALSGAQWWNLADTARYGAIAFGGGVALIALVAARRLTGARRHLRAMVTSPAALLPVWLAGAVVSFLIGGGFWRHYWLLLAAPVSALTGAALSRAGALRIVALAAVVTPCLIISIWVFAGKSSTLTVRATGDRRSPVDAQVADWFVHHRRRGDNLYALCASSAVYADAHQDPGFPYLWFPEVYAAPHTESTLLAYLGDPRSAPRFIAQYQSPGSCDQSGRLKSILTKSYHRVHSIGVATILERNR